MERFNTIATLIDDIASFLPIALLALLVVLLVRRYATKPQVVVDAFDCDEKLCPSNVLSAVLISEISSVGAGRQLERVADSSSVTALDFAALAGDRARWLAALLQVASLKRRIRVSGIAFEANEHEVAVNVSVTGTNNVVMASRAFTNKDPEKPTKVLLRELVHDAASWTLFELDRTLGREPRRNLGTCDWRSWGRFRRAVWRDAQGMPDAREAYAEAVEFDPDNWGAWINLGSLDVRTAPARALRRLETAQELIERDGAPELQPAYYRLLYLMGIVHLNCSIDPDQLAHRDEHRTRAVDAVTRLVTLSAKTRLRIREGEMSGPVVFGGVPARTREDLESTLALVQPTAISLLASAKVNAGQPVGGPVPPSIHLVSASAWLGAQKRLSTVGAASTPHDLLVLLSNLMTDEQFLPGADYNLACMYSRALSGQDDGIDEGLTREQLVDAALRHLARSIESGRRRAIARDDAAFRTLKGVVPGRFEQVVSEAEAPVREPEVVPSGRTDSGDAVEPDRSPVVKSVPSVGSA